MTEDKVAILKPALCSQFICQNYHLQEKQAQFQHVRLLACVPVFSVLPLQQLFDFPSLSWLWYALLKLLS